MDLLNEAVSLGAAIDILQVMLFFSLLFLVVQRPGDGRVGGVIRRTYDTVAHLQPPLDVCVFILSRGGGGL